nr:MAG TPA: hypothetical protein [Caudoviricetes sp.]
MLSSSFLVSVSSVWRIKWIYTIKVVRGTLVFLSLFYFYLYFTKLNSLV